MIRLETSALRSIVGRRIFFLFIACALLPIVVLGWLSFNEVSSQLRESGRADLLSTSKAYGMEIMGRLETLSAEFSLIAASRNFEPGSSQQPPEHFSSLSKMAPNEPAALWGAPVSFSPRQREFLLQGQTVLLVLPGTQPQIALFRYFKPSEPDRGLLAAMVDSKYVFSEETLSANTAVNVHDSTGALIFCSSNSQACSPPSNRYNTSSGSFESRSAGRSIFVAYWNLFLRGNFMSDPWTIVATRDSDIVLAPIRRFRRTFPFVVLLSLWVVLLLSIVQIRRTLVPLETLSAAARKIAHQDFATKVDLNSGDEFEELARTFNSMTADLGQHFEQLHRFHWGTLKALARAIDAKSTWTAGHSERVTQMALQIARVMNLSEEDLETLQRGGLLHDIGKLGTPPEILDKPGRLTPEEMKIMQDHVLTGVRILEPIVDFRPALPVVAQHHENFDGTGYPHGLSGENIDIKARILAVADCYDAIVSDRPYRKGLPSAKVIEILKEGTGTKFDPEVINAFLHAMETARVDSGIKQPDTSSTSVAASDRPQIAPPPSIIGKTEQDRVST